MKRVEITFSSWKKSSRTEHTLDSPSSSGEAVVAVWMEAKERSHTVNTAQQHGQQPPLYRHLQPDRQTDIQSNVACKFWSWKNNATRSVRTTVQAHKRNLVWFSDWILLLVLLVATDYSSNMSRFLKQGRRFLSFLLFLSCILSIRTWFQFRFSSISTLKTPVRSGLKPTVKATATSSTSPQQSGPEEFSPLTPNFQFWEFLSPSPNRGWM